MRWTTRVFHAGAILAMLWAMPTAGLAADAFDDRLAEAQRVYRQALFVTRDGGVAQEPRAVAQAVHAFVTVMEALVREFSDPPPRYAEDPQWTGTLEEIGGLGRGAVAAAESGDVVRAHDHLELIRRLIGDLRRRNGVLVYSDTVNAYHVEVEAVLLGGYTAESLAGEDARGRLREQVGVLEYLASRLEQEAPYALLTTAEFRPAIDDLYASIRALRRGMAARDVAATMAGMQGLLPPYWAFFLKFG